MLSDRDDDVERKIIVSPAIGADRQDSESARYRTVSCESIFRFRRGRGSHRVARHVTHSFIRVTLCRAASFPRRMAIGPWTEYSLTLRLTGASILADADDADCREPLGTFDGMAGEYYSDVAGDDIAMQVSGTDRGFHAIVAAFNR